MFIATKDAFYSDKHVFVATKMILVAAPANDRVQYVLVKIALRLLGHGRGGAGLCGI